MSFASVSTFLYQYISKDIRITQQKLTGVTLLPPLFKFIQLLQQHRGASAGVLGGGHNLSSVRLTLLRQSINSFVLLEQQLPPNILASEAWSKIVSEWQSIVEQGMDWSVATNFNRHTALIKSLQALINIIADQYYLTTPHSIGTYYLINTALHQLMPTLENLGKIRALGTGILAMGAGASQKNQRLKLAILRAESKKTIELLMTDLAKTGQYNPQIKSLLFDVSQDIHNNTEAILKSVEFNILNSHYAITAESFYNQVTGVINSNYTILYDKLLPTSLQVITTQLTKARQIFFISSVIILAMILILIYVGIAIYLSTMENINTITQATLAFAKGDFNKRLQPECNNEFSIVSQSFNSMAEDIVTLLETKKRGVARIRAIVESSQDALIQMNSNGDIIGWNGKAETMFGWSQSQVMGKPLHEYIIPIHYRKRHIQGLHHFLETGKASALNTLIEIEALHADGHEFPIELTLSAIKLENEYEFNAFIRDITDRKQIESTLQLTSQVFRDTNDGIIITDTNQQIIDINPAFCTITGYSYEEVIGQNISILNSGRQTPEFYAAMWQKINETGHWQGEVWNQKKDGDLYAEHLSITALRDENGTISHYVGLFSDITQSKQQQEKLALMAHYDVLTNLPNRALFADRFHQAIAHSKRKKQSLAVCFLDLDNFKPVNDNYGHTVGDKLLVEVTKRITSCIREEDTLSRQGGDEFALLINDIGSFEQVQQTLDRIHSKLARPYLIDNYPHKITASSGVTLYPDDDSDIDTLLRHADQAMYQAKLAGKHRYKLFNPLHDKQIIEQYTQQEEIAHALAYNELSLYYQPKINLLTGEIYGVEALIRWNHPEKGVIPPLDFLPIIEGTDLEIEIGNWVINKALKQLGEWHQLGIQPQISVNISSRHLLSGSFINQLDAILANYPSIDSHCLQLEILESAALGDLDMISSILTICQNTLGLSVALDDFGTGYSSLTHLRNLPVDIIKIDQHFVRDMLDDPDDYNIIEGIISLSNAFDRDVIAEGVESTHHGLMLAIMGCTKAQGFGIAKPMPANEFPQWLKSNTPNKEWTFYDHRDRRTKENKITLFELVTRQWEAKFITRLQSSPESITHWPILNSERCSCGKWLQRMEQETLFEQGALKRLEQAHKAFHAIANTLSQYHHDSDHRAIKEELPKFRAAFADMTQVMKLM